MNSYKNDLRAVASAELRSRRDRLAASLPGAAGFLAGSLAEQRRTCGKKGCRCAEGELHGPYAYLAVAGRRVYVPAVLGDAVRARLEGSARLREALERSPRSTWSCWTGGNWIRRPLPACRASAAAARTVLTRPPTAAQPEAGAARGRCGRTGQRTLGCHRGPGRTKAVGPGSPHLHLRLRPQGPYDCARHEHVHALVRRENS
jgi:hypothetical protein